MIISPPARDHVDLSLQDQLRILKDDKTAYIIIQVVIAASSSINSEPFRATSNMNSRSTLLTQLDVQHRQLTRKFLTELDGPRLTRHMMVCDVLTKTMGRRGTCVNSEPITSRTVIQHGHVPRYIRCYHDTATGEFSNHDHSIRTRP